MVKRDQEDSLISRIRESKYGDHPLRCDVVLPFRKPVDLLPMSNGVDIHAPEFGLAPDEELYDHLMDVHLTPRTKVAKVQEGSTKSFGHFSPVNSPRSPRTPGNERGDGEGRPGVSPRNKSIMKKEKKRERQITLRDKDTDGSTFATMRRRASRMKDY